MRFRLLLGLLLPISPSVKALPHFDDKPSFVDSFYSEGLQAYRQKNLQAAANAWLKYREIRSRETDLAADPQWKNIEPFYLEASSALRRSSPPVCLEDKEEDDLSWADAFSFASQPKPKPKPKRRYTVRALQEPEKASVLDKTALSRIKTKADQSLRSGQLEQALALYKVIEKMDPTAEISTRIREIEKEMN